MKKRYFSLSIYILLISLFSTIIFLCIVLWGSNLYLKQNMVREQNFRNENVFKSSFKREAGRFAQLERSLDLQVKAIAPHTELHKDQLFRLAESLIEKHRVFQIVMIAYTNKSDVLSVNKDFDIVCAWWNGHTLRKIFNPIELSNRNHVEWFTKAYQTGKSSWSSLYLDPLVNCQTVAYSVPLKDERDSVRAVFTVCLTLQNIGLELKKSPLNRVCRSFVCDTSGKFYYRSYNGAWQNLTLTNEDPDSFIGEKRISKKIRDFNIDKIYLELIKHFEEVPEGNFRMTDVLGTKSVMIYYRRSEMTGSIWGEIVGEHHVLETVRLANNNALVCFFIGIVFVTIFSFLVSGLLTKPIRAFVHSTRAIIAGDFNYPLPKTIFVSEIKGVRATFSTMRKALKKQIHKIRKLTVEKEAVFAQLEVARKIQLGMLNDDFEAPKKCNVDLFALTRNYAELAGSIYDFDILDDGSICFCIGKSDISDLSASLFMNQVQTFLWASLAIQRDPALALLLVNKEIFSLHGNTRTTSVLSGIYQPKTGEILFACAGAEFFVAVSKGDNAEEITYNAGAPLAKSEKSNYNNQSILLKKDDLFFIGTDDLITSQDDQPEIFQKNRLLKKLIKASNYSVRDLLEDLAAKVDQQQCPPDNIALLALRPMKGEEQ